MSDEDLLKIDVMDELNKFTYRAGIRDCTLDELNVCPKCKCKMDLYSITTPTVQPIPNFINGKLTTDYNIIPGKLVFTCPNDRTEVSVKIDRMERIKD
mgnify:CR=1 FL=1